MKQIYYNLDQKDRKILQQLSLNARISIPQLAKKINLSQEATSYRIKKLETNQVITGYQTIINLSKLGIIQFKICLTLQHITTKILNQIIKQLKPQEEIKWIVTCDGKWDIIISAEANSISEVHQIKSKITETFQDHIQNKEIAILVSGTAYSRNYLTEEKTKSNQKVLMQQETEIIKLSTQEIKILKILSTSARTTAVQIATKLNTTARIISYAIQQLEKKKIILGYKIAINYEKLKIKFYKTFIYLENTSSVKIQKLNAYLETHPNVIHDGVVLASWDIEPEFEYPSENDFHTQLDKLKDNFSDVIKKIEITAIRQEHKFIYF